ncbi:DUF92 domain-containing protein [Pelodictyon luteolum]|uniref:Membrane protein n=1 Tax=Chlorobium luteolum (strain DSM 273 / BCRC 81028 / 2530) TaxID=319225 RepID=Q3B588_CHLL3|nr:DUF92 domain-containing protein [Pelodictyon luteolum]ABB23493.1 membrane protein [Pelodictyon luteolum DSM 273]
MLNLPMPSVPELPAFLLSIGLLGLFIALSELLAGRFGLNRVVARKIVHLGTGVVLFFVPSYFDSNFYPVLLALFFLALNSLNLSFGWFTSMLSGSEGDGRGSQAVKSYGSIYLPLAFLFGALLLWDEHRWILQTAVLAATVGDSLAALAGSAFGKHPIADLTRNTKTVEGSATMFFVSLLLISLSLLFFRPEFHGGLEGASLLTLLLLALLLALISTAVEALLSYGLDNFFLPVATAYVLYLLEGNQAALPSGFLAGGLFAFLLAVFSLKVRFLNNSGATATFLLGTTIFGIGGMVWTVPLLTFYLLSSVLSKLGRKRKAKFDLVFEKGSQRDAGQVYANGGIAWILMVVYSLTGNPAVFFAYLGTLAAVQADTWATEIGTMWPNPKAWLVTTLKPVAVGTSGGVSFPGTAGAFIGSLFICLSAVVAGVPWLSDFGLLNSFLLVGLSGLLASLVDSFFGATLQAQYYDPIREKVTERTHSMAADGTKVENRLLKGYALVNNDLVNTLCALSGSALAFLVIQNAGLF